MDSFYFPSPNLEPDQESDTLSEEEFQAQLDNAWALFDLNSELSEQTTLDELSKFHPDVQAEVLDLLGLAFLPPSETEYTDAPEFQRNCNKGYACKAACIAKTKECLSPLNGQARNYADWLIIQQRTGAPLSPSHLADIAANRTLPTVPPPLAVPTPTPAPTPQRRRGRAAAVAIVAPAPAPPVPKPQSNPLPNDVVVKDDKPETGTATYSFKVGRNTVKVHFVGTSEQDSDLGQYNAVRVSFSVNNRYTRNKTMTKAEQDASSAKINKIFQHHVSRQQNQAVFSCSATIKDQDGVHRAYAYEIVGFSRPHNGEAGGTQVAFVQNGKVDRDKSRQLIERAERYDSAVIAQNDQKWAQTVQQYQQQRAAARASRRAQVQAIAS